MKILAHSDYQSPPESGNGVLVLANDVNALDVNLDGITQVDLQFPAFTDGRAFTQAYLLRRRRGFRYQLREVLKGLKMCCRWLDGEHPAVTL